ncbi:MAG TPA: prepilin-type N-terminal cleavage/methylation domain-containing protein [Candidatus Deferrimicrobiaceae bacterium]|jgi:type IV pilus assembly protein PilA
MLNSKKGFTLIELMIVVAIIGILAAIAIPNFMKFQAKSRTAEAKTNLGAIFTAETSYFGDANKFGDFTQVGWKPTGITRYQYTQDGAVQATLDLMHEGKPGVQADGTAPGWLGDITNTGVAGEAPSVTVNTFTIGAAGNPNNSTTDPLDCWEMNDVRILRYTQTGI